MDVSGQDFLTLLPTIFSDIQNDLFVDFDTELSGIPTRSHHRGPKDHGLPTLEARYAETKAAAEKFHILQLGLTCVLEDEAIPSSFVLKSYNFFVNPLPQDRLWIEREFSFHSGAVKFLRQQSFNLDAPLILGVPYLSRVEEAGSRKGWESFKGSTDFTVDTVLREQDQPSLAFMQQVRDDINAWIDDKTPNKPDYVNIAPNGFVSDPFAHGLSSFQSRLVHPLTLREYPNLKTITKPGGFIQILIRDNEKEKESQAVRNESYERRLATAKGLRWPIEALARGDLSSINSKVIPAPLHELEATRKTFEHLRETLKDKRTVLVGHNVFMDLMYLYACFFGPLPSTVTQFSKEISKLFPNVIDTKYMATHNSLNVSLEQSSLPELSLKLEHTPSPKILFHPDHARYAVEKSLHEAGYDSMLTATILIRLSAKLQSEGEWVDVPSPDSSEEEAYHTPSEEVGGEAMPASQTSYISYQKPGRKSDGECFATRTVAQSLSQNAKYDLEHGSQKPSKSRQFKSKKQQNRDKSRHQSPPRKPTKSHPTEARRVPTNVTPPSKSPSRLVPTTPPFIPNSEKAMIQARIDRITGHTPPACETSPSPLRPSLFDHQGPGSRFQTLSTYSREPCNGKENDDLIDLSSPPTTPTKAQCWVNGKTLAEDSQHTVNKTSLKDEADNGYDQEQKEEGDDKDDDEASPTIPTSSLTMPAFDSHFWEVYGNKLRVNGTREGICKLKTWQWG